MEIFIDNFDDLSMFGIKTYARKKESKVKAIQMKCDFRVIQTLVKRRFENNEPGKQKSISGRKGDYIVIDSDSVSIYSEKAFLELFEGIS